VSRVVSEGGPFRQFTKLIEKKEDEASGGLRKEGTKGRGRKERGEK